jgi:hypothetical protein
MSNWGMPRHSPRRPGDRVPGLQYRPRLRRHGFAVSIAHQADGATRQARVAAVPLPGQRLASSVLNPLSHEVWRQTARERPKRPPWHQVRVRSYRRKSCGSWGYGGRPGPRRLFATGVMAEHWRLNGNVLPTLPASLEARRRASRQQECWSKGWPTTFSARAESATILSQEQGLAGTLEAAAEIARTCQNETERRRPASTTLRPLWPKLR